MDINPAKKQLRFARRALDDMKASQDLDDAERNWNSFLNHIEQVFEKIKIACSTVCKKYPSFISPINAQRSSDPLLVYLKQARNALHHGIKEVADRDPAHVTQTISGDNVSIDRLVIKQGVVAEYTGNNPIHTYFVPERIVVVDVINRQVHYPVPTHHLGSPIHTLNPIEIGEHGFAYYDNFLSMVEAELINN